MGKQSSLGPIDPQFGNMAAFGVIDEFTRAADEIKRNPASIPLWQTIFSKIPAGFITECSQAIKLSSHLVSEWLKNGMFQDNPNAAERAERIVDSLNNHKDTMTHGRHISASRAIEIGLSIRMLEDDQTLQDLVLSVHHACIHTLSQSSNLHKFIENHLGVGIFTR